MCARICCSSHECRSYVDINNAGEILGISREVNIDHISVHLKVEIRRISVDDESVCVDEGWNEYFFGRSFDAGVRDESQMEMMSGIVEGHFQGNPSDGWSVGPNVLRDPPHSPGTVQVVPSTLIVPIHLRLEVLISQFHIHLELDKTKPIF